jgi:anti-sigma B factor antagonist
MDIKTWDHRNVVVFDINGEISRSEMPEPTLHQQVKGNLERGKRDILLNLKNVGFIDSFGIGEILASFVSTQNLGGKLKLCHVSKKLYLLFQVTMLVRVLEIFDDCDGALKSFEAL